MTCMHFTVTLSRGGLGGLDVLLRVPRAARSSFTCAKPPDHPILRVWYAARCKPLLSQLGARCVRRSEIKGEPAQQAEDIRGDGYGVAQAGLKVRTGASFQLGGISRHCAKHRN
jgi:hypothetical protein